MHKFLLVILLFLIFLIFAPIAFAANNSFVSVVNPIRGNDFWDLKDQKPVDAIKGQLELLNKYNVPATWLIRFDALTDPQILSTIKTFPNTNELGLFLEVTPTWTRVAGVTYRQSAVWHLAESVFLTGYNPKDREKLIDAVFLEFKDTFGYYPKSVGAWWIDAYSLNYMQEKYKIDGALIVADQYSTDNYQIWGQYFATPYYPSFKNALFPAQTKENKIPVVMMQWATRDPINGYGEGVNETTYSLQANDYIDYHKLDSTYFQKLIDIYLKQPFNQFNHLVMGLENSYSWEKYKFEYEQQIKIINQKKKARELSIFTMENFSSWYKNQFPNLSPEQIILANDALGTDQKVIWYMNPYYRAGWFYNKDGGVFRDVRPYGDSQIEPCYLASCSEIKFATSPLFVLDDVTYKQKYVVDASKISNVNLSKKDNGYILSYKNEAGRNRIIEFLPRDIAIDGINHSIDGFILEAQKLHKENNQVKVNLNPTQTLFTESFLNFFFKIAKFLLFIFLVLFIPGFLLVRYLKLNSLILILFLSVAVGLVNLTLLSFILGYIKLSGLIYIYPLGCLLVFFFKKYFKEIDFPPVNLNNLRNNLPFIFMIFLGTFFQSLAMIRSGWVYNFGVGFWGPIGHDGIWHQALIAQLIQQIPPQNPAFAGVSLSNYHYFFDLLIAASYKMSQIPVLDLLYRFYPVLFSLLLGIGSYYLIKKFTNSKLAVFISLYFIYFAGSFGFIVDILKKREWGGESAFWVNQPVSMNLNPPFAISLIIIISILLVLWETQQRSSKIGNILLMILAGSLIEFKVYAGVIVLGGLIFLSLQQLIIERKTRLLKIFIGSTILSAIVFLPQNSQANQLLVFSPFWFIHTMIDFSDRVGWDKLAQARLAYFERGEWFKYILTEGLALTIFILGNLGLRLVSLFALIVFIKKRLWHIPEYLFILIMAIISLLIPILFIQKGNNWNTIQFFYYFLYFTAVFTGSVFIFIFQHFPKIIAIPLLLIFLLITPISAITTFKNGFYPFPPATLPIGELEALTFLQNLPFGNVLTYPFDKNLRGRATEPFPLLVYETSAYVSAFSGKAVFLEDEIQQEILQNNFQKRLVASNDFFRGADPKWSKQFLIDNTINYIYLPKIYRLSLDWSTLPVNKVFENDTSEIYQAVK